MKSGRFIARSTKYAAAPLRDLRTLKEFLDVGDALALGKRRAIELLIVQRTQAAPLEARE